MPDPPASVDDASVAGGVAGGVPTRDSTPPPGELRSDDAGSSEPVGLADALELGELPELDVGSSHLTQNVLCLTFSSLRPS
jgi:hypothetical protein